MDGYLSVIQKGYRTAFRLRLLKNNPSYQWHYFVLKLVRQGDFILDIGANLGYFTQQFAAKVRHGGHLYCVEPVAPFRKQLRKLVAGQPNITILPYALGEEADKPVTLGIPAEFENLGYLRHGTTTLLHGNKSGKGTYSFEATMKKGSELFATLPRLDYIKCDIEGYETVVLPEMKNVLEKFQPLVQLETWGSQLMQMYAFFKNLGFAAYYLENNRLKPLEGKPQERWGESDLLFVPPRRLDSIAPFLA